MNVPRAVIAAGVAATMALPVGATRFDSFTQRFANNPDQAKVVAAGYLGGAGTEWLVGGGFQPDGTVVLVGTALGPTLEIAGTTARALGADMAALAEVKQATDPRNPAKTLPMGWAHENATAFVVRLSPDLKTVRSVVRFPWKSAGATSAAVDEQGAIYLAGVAGEGFAMAFPDAQVSPVDLEKIGPTTVPTRTIYLAKMAPDGGKAEWLRTMTGPSNAPVVDVDAAGLLRLQGPDVRCFDTAGALKQTAIVPGGMTTRNAVSPADGSFCYAHEHNWPTGREPWRCPVLKVYDKDGALQHHLYDWGGPFVGLGEMRLVSDTAIRAATYDKDGNLIITLWSDGGNSVALREPMDVYRVSPNIKGLGMSSWGAGVLSLAYIIKLDGKTFRVASGTIWSAYLKDRDKPNSIWVDAMGFGAEGSTLMGGRSATGLIQTGNNLNPYTKADPTVVPSGTYVAVMGPDFASLRFSSGMPNCGATDLANGKPWAFRTGTANGKPLALVMGGATGKNADGYTAPMVNPLQPAFGGGLTDGHVLVLDLSQAQ